MVFLKKDLEPVISQGQLKCCTQHYCIITGHVLKLVRGFFFCRVEKNISCRVKKRSLIRTLVIKKMMKKKKRKIKRIFRAHCPKCFKKEMAWQSQKDKRKRKRKRKREKEQLVARTTLMITEKAERLWIPSACSLFY
jgi:hypothetical protein